jgi:RNA polymerase sigma factor
MDDLAAQAAQDEEARARLIQVCDRFILKTVFRCTHRYVRKSDDEWSVALIAFSNAIDTYNPQKGGFFAYAELVMRSRLADYRRSQSKYAMELDVSPAVFSGEVEQDEAYSPMQAMLLKRTAVEESTDLKYEILAANDIFRRYGFTFFDLAQCSPKSAKTRQHCAEAVIYMLRHPALKRRLRESKQLPLRALCANTGVPRKLLERHRKYIIAAIEIFDGDYPCLREYMRFIRRRAIMNAVIVELRGKKAAALLEDGTVVVVANSNYEVGQRIRYTAKSRTSGDAMRTARKVSVWAAGIGGPRYV